MASDPVVRLTRGQEHNWAMAWQSFAWHGPADGAGGSQERRAYAQWQCHGAPPAVWEWIAEWLERDEIGSSIVDDTEDDPDDGPDDDPELFWSDFMAGQRDWD